MILVRAIEQTYLNEKEKRTFKVWHPQVKFKGKWCFLPDDSSRTKLQEASDELAATQMALESILEIEYRMNRCEPND